MTERSKNHETDALFAALRRVRRRVRGLLVAEAAGRLLVGVILVAGVLSVLDWWVRFPWFVRINFLVIGGIFAGIWAYQSIWRPLTAPIHLDQLALGLQSLPSGLKDRLAGTVAYLRGEGEGSPELWRQVVNETIRSVEEIPAFRVFRARPAVRSMVSATGVLVVLAVTTWLVPEYVTMGATRLARPLADAEWPKSTQISPLTTDAVVAWGEALTVEMRLDRGDRSSVRGFVRWSPSGRQHQREQMRRDTDGVYRFTLENIRTPLTYSFSAGDDDTGGHPFHVKVVRRPAVETARLTLTPPTYARHLPVQSRVLDEAPVVALRGCEARIELTPDRAIGREGPSRAALIMNGETSLPLVPEDDSGATFTTTFTVEKNVTMEAVLVDENGLESHGGVPFRIQIRQDEPPSVAIQQPSSVTEATAAAVVELQSTAQDDVGLASFALLASKSEPEYQPIADLLSAAVRGASDAVGPAPPLRCDLVYSWNLEPLQAVAGDVIRYYVEARDGYQLEGRTHEPVRSPVMTINVISPEQLADRLRSDLLAIRGPLRDLLTELLETTDRTKRLDAKLANAVPLDERGRQMVEAIAGQLQRLASTGRQTTERVEEVVRKAVRNGETLSESARQAARLARRLQGSVDEPLKEAAKAMARAGDAGPAERQHDALTASAEAQEDIASSLQAMLDEVERWSDFEELVRKLREVLDRQEALQRETAGLARNVGRSGGEADESSIPALAARGAASQSQLRSDAAALVQSMRTWARQRQETDSAASYSVETAAGVSEDKGLAAMMGEAAEALGESRFGRASELQRESAAVLRAMLATLEQKPDRELADLSRALQDVTARLRKIIKAQEELIHETGTAGDQADVNETLPRLADRQATLKKTTGALTGKIKASDDEGPAARKSLLAAMLAMGNAEELLEGLRAADALGAQADALDGLQTALDLLEHLEARTEQAIAERSLAQIIAMLGELKRAQAAVRGETAEIQGRSSTDRRLSRADGLKAAKLAKEQRGLTTPLQAVREKLQASVVYDYVCDKIAGGMETAATKLEDKDCPSALAMQDVVLRDLTSLLESAAEEPKRDATRFVEDSGGGGAGSPTPEKPVPTLAELKVLRRMQTEVSARTAALDRSMPDPLLRSETQLQEIKSVGESQQDLHDLAIRMIEKAGGPKEE